MCGSARVVETRFLDDWEDENREEINGGQNIEKEAQKKEQQTNGPSETSRFSRLFRLCPTAAANG